MLAVSAVRPMVAQMAVSPALAVGLALAAVPVVLADLAAAVLADLAAADLAAVALADLAAVAPVALATVAPADLAAAGLAGLAAVVPAPERPTENLSWKPLIKYTNQDQRHWSLTRSTLKPAH